MDANHGQYHCMQFHVFSNRRILSVQLLIRGKRPLTGKKRALCTWLLYMSLACVHIHWLCAVCDFLPSRLSVAAAAAIMPPAVITPPRARARRGRLLPLPIRVALALVILALTFDSVGIGLPTQLPGSRSLWTFDAWRRPQTEPLKAFLKAYILQGLFQSFTGL